MLVIFDCDGVLVDSEPIANGILAAHLRASGVALSDAEVMAQFRGRSAAGCVQHMQQWMGADQAQTQWQALQRETLKALAQVQPVPGVMAVLAELQAAGRPFCVASSGDHEKMQVTLTASGIEAAYRPKRFSVTQVDQPKPAPDVFLLAARAMGYEPGQCVVVEDTRTGVLAGVAAGMPVLWYGGPANVQIDGDVTPFTHMKELPQLLQARGVLHG